MLPVMVEPFFATVLVTMTMIRDAIVAGGFELLPGPEAQLPPQKLSALLA